MRYSREPFFWSLFSAGGVVTAILIPVMIVVTGFLIPAGTVSFLRLENVFGNMIVKLVVFGLAFLTFMHSANRIRHALLDMGIPKSLFVPVSVISYVAAIVGTVWAATVILN